MEQGDCVCPRPGLAKGEFQPLSDTAFHAEAHYAQKPWMPPTSTMERQQLRNTARRPKLSPLGKDKASAQVERMRSANLPAPLWIPASLLPSAPPQLSGPMLPYIFSEHTPAMLAGAIGTPQLLYLFRGKPEADAA